MAKKKTETKPILQQGKGLQLLPDTPEDEARQFRWLGQENNTTSAVDEAKPKKRKIRWRNWILSGMTLLLGGAIYWNWQSVSDRVATMTGQDSSDVHYFGEAELAGTSVMTSEGDAVLTAARTARRQEIDSEKRQLSGTAADETLPKETRAKAAENMAALQQRFTACNEMETRILAKGFTDCMVYYDGKQANVLVKTPSALKSGDVVAIRDVVIDATGLAASEITVAEVFPGGEKAETTSS